MANKPDDPKRPSPDDKSTPPLDSDSAIDFSDLNEEDMSGISVIEWASLVENPSKAIPDSTVAKLPAGEGDEAIDFGGSAQGPAQAGKAGDPISSDSSIDLGSSEVIEQQAPSPEHVNLASAGVIDLGAIDPSDLPGAHGGSSGPGVLELGPDSLVDSGAMPLDEDEAIELGPESLMEIGQSGVDLAGAPDQAGRPGGSSVSFDEVLLEQPKGGSGGGSKRDLIAEGLESGVDMPSSDEDSFIVDGTEPSVHHPASDEDDFLAQVKEADAESSSVDLGSMHSVPIFDMTEEEARKSSGPMPVDEDEAIDLTDPGLEEVAPPQPAKAKPAAKAAEPAAAAKADKPKPPAADRPRAKVGGLVGVGSVGALAGAAAMFGAVSLNLVPGVGGPAPKAAVGSLPPPVAAAPAVTFDRTMDQIRAGDLDKVDPAMLDRAEEDKPEQLVARAEYHWLSYLKKERGANPAAGLRPDADEVKKALSDLDKAIASANAEAAAEALFLRGQIHEAMGNAAAARADYVAGADKLPARKPQFDAALQVMDLTMKIGRLVPPGLSPRSLALILVAFQAPEGAAAPALPAEAGLSFWQAVLAAKQNKYADAVKLLDQARADHDRRRYLLPRKPQNPTTDPSERVFLRACDLLKEHWLLLERLNNPGYLAAMPKDRVPQVDAILSKAGETAGAAMLKDMAARLAKDKPVASVEELVKFVEAERKAKDEKIAFLEKSDEAQKKELATVGETLKTATATLAKSEDARKAAEAGLKQARADGDAALAALKEIGAAAGTDFSDLKTSKGAIVRAVAEAVKTAKTTDPTGSIRKLQGELAEAREKLGQRWEPAQMLAVWAPLLDGQRDRKDLAASAVRDADRVAADPAAKPADKALALLVQGLALRNEEKYAAALPVLKKAAAGLDGDARARADAAVGEAANPAATVARQAAELARQGKRAEALAVLERGLKTLPDPKGPLYVRRAWLALDTARAKGQLTADSPLLAEARKDAERSRTAEGAFLLGRIAEELGNPAEAVGHFRTAVRAHNKTDEEGSRYRIALARALLRARPSSAPAAPPALPAPTRTGRLPIDLVGLVVALTLQGPAGDAAAGEAEKLADEILAMGDKAPFDVRAQALAIKGLHTRAVTTFVNGLRDKGRLPAEDANTLIGLMADHPGLRRPESKATPDPMLSERYYGAGLNFFFARRFADAEREFLSAIESDSSDARYFYYLGLARLAQGKRDAMEDFDQGARLEQAGRPDRAAVSASLERIQGRMRRELSEVRDRPTRDAK
jgi:hypothetical protein